MTALNIKIAESNKAAIEAALKAVNGKAYDHAYTSFAEIAELAVAAEEALAALNLPLKERAGATWAETSGAPVPNAYKYSREGTTVKLARRGAGWYLVSASRMALYKEGGGKGRLALTEAQAAEATKRFQAGFSVIKAA